MEGVFAYEEVTPALDLLPLAARRALDRAGLRLSLAAWRAMPLASRRALVEAGAHHDVDVAHVAALLVGAEPAPEAIAPADDPDPSRVPEALASALPAGRALDPAAWSALAPLRRYALLHAVRSAAKRADPAVLARALDEHLGAIVSTHLTPRGDVRMVDVGEKAVTHRRAVAEARVVMQPETARRLARGDTPKGEVLATARVAGIMAAKRTPELVPMCHGVALTRVAVELAVDEAAACVRVTATAEARDRTGVEMEALVAATTASLTLYDMLKGIDRGMTIDGVRLVEKSGGRSGDWRREP